MAPSERPSREFRFPDTIRVVRQGDQGPFLEIDGQMLPFFIEDVSTVVTRSPGIEVVVKLRAQRVITINDWMSQRDRDRSEQAKLVEETKMREGESGG